MAELPADWTPPPRSILYARPFTNEEGSGVIIGCDCGTTTQVVIEGIEHFTSPSEMSITCSCLSVHWFTVGPVEVTGG